MEKGHFTQEFNIEQKNKGLKIIRDGFGVRKDPEAKEEASRQFLKGLKDKHEKILSTGKVLDQMKLSTTSFGFPQEWPLTRYVKNRFLKLFRYMTDLLKTLKRNSSSIIRISSSSSFCRTRETME